MTTVPIPGEDAPLTVLEFEQGASGQVASEHIDPPFIIDHENSLSVYRCNMLSSLTAWVKKKAPGQVCIINGLVKTGRTAALTKVLPQLVLQHEPDALFCHLDFGTIFKPDVHERDAAHGLLVHLQTWCRKAGLHVPPGSTGTTYAHVKCDILELLDALQHSDRTIFFLFDEVCVHARARAVVRWWHCSLFHCCSTANTVPSCASPPYRFSSSSKSKAPTTLCSRRCCR